MMTLTHTQTLMATQRRKVGDLVGTVHNDDTVCAAINWRATESFEAAKPVAPKWVGQALSLIAAAVVIVGLGVVAVVALLVTPPPAQTQVVRPAAPHVFSIPGPGSPP
jgi:hypothetical protein